MTAKAKIAILFPAFLGGGAEMVALRAMETLKRDYALTLFTFSKLNLDSLGQKYGVDIKSGDAQIIIPFEKSGLAALLVKRASLYTLRQHILSAYYKRVSSSFDLALALYGEMDLGRRGIQYVHWPLFAHGSETARKILGYPISIPNKIYWRACELLSSYSDQRLKANRTLTNSKWTASFIEKSYGIPSEVLYPPAVITATPLPFEKRETGFICISRIVPQKRIEKVIEILEKVRSSGHPIHLHLFSGSEDPQYRHSLETLFRKHAEWIFVEDKISRSQLDALLASHRFGLHMMENEPFGIAVAEMLVAGCIPFAPNSGGQTEILDNHPELLFNDNEEAVAKIATMLSNETKQKNIIDVLGKQKNQFTLGSFQESLRKFVQSELSRPNDMAQSP